MSMQVIEPRAQGASQITVFRHQLNQMSEQFQFGLPSHIPPQRFMRVIVTAVQNNPELLECDRRSLLNACMKAAQDGILPDGREGAIVVRWNGKKNCKEASWQPMIAGLRKKVRNSGEIATWDVQVVKRKDKFAFRLGDDPFIDHEPSLEDDPGPTIAAYSIAVLKSGEKSREVMSIGAIRKIRDTYSDGWKSYKAGRIKSTPWANSEDEMAKKTVARRHSKVLPMSTDLDDLVKRLDPPHENDNENEAALPARPNTLAGRLDALAAMDGSTEVDEETGDVIELDQNGDAAGEAQQETKTETAKPETQQAETNSARTAVVQDAEANDGIPAQLDRRGETLLAMLNGQAEQCKTVDDLIEVQQDAQKQLAKASPATKQQAIELFRVHLERLSSETGEA